jgi:hypothetical protein
VAANEAAALDSKPTHDSGMGLIYVVKKWVRDPQRRALGIMLAGTGAILAILLELRAAGLNEGNVARSLEHLIYGTLVAGALVCVVFSFILSRWIPDLYPAEPKPPVN